MSPPAAAVAATADHTAVEVPAVPLSFADRPGLLDAEGRLMLKNLTLEELQEWCEAAGGHCRGVRLQVAAQSMVGMLARAMC